MQRKVIAMLPVCSMVIGLLLILSSALLSSSPLLIPSPATIQTEENGAIITINVSQTVFFQSPGCFSLIWKIEGISSLYLNGEGVVGDSSRNLCSSTSVVLHINFQDGTGKDYVISLKFLSPLMIAPGLLFITVALSGKSLTRQNTLIIRLLWIIGAGILVLAFLRMFVYPQLVSAGSPGAILIFAGLVSLLYWTVVPPGSRVIFLLGAGLYTFVGHGVQFEYLLLLTVLIVWTSVLLPEPLSTAGISPVIAGLCGFSLIVFAINIVAMTDSTLRKSVSELSTLTMLLVVATVILTCLAFRMGHHFSNAQRQIFINGGIFLFLAFFVILKLPGSQVIGWVGYSYFAFRMLHMLLEIRRKTPLPVLPVHHVGLYATFFPTQPVGPIDLFSHFGPQMQTKQIFSWDDYGKGWWRIFQGAIKKFYIADVLLATIIPGTVPIEYLTPLAALVQLYAYAFYIYYDFSGSIDMVIGTARLLGYRLPENFDHPYRKSSIAGFWQSWHITLSGWARTYIYFPLMRTLLRTHLKYSVLAIVLITNLVTMILIGLWHGFTLNFIVWGAWHAVGLFIHKVFSDQTRRRQIRWRGTWKAQGFYVVSVFLTFHYVALGWIFFVFPGIEQSLAFLKKLGGLL